ncbi:VOC family protein [Actinomadura darangshiensis]|uniref:VOC family protein n=1 Tax=Actinomadura darangshiensis TaxID=705336 RepID=UPI0014082317|nr:VOC family protein [Actinomadura darangshiensis]
MAVRFYHLVIGSRGLAALAEFWSSVLNRPGRLTLRRRGHRRSGPARLSRVALRDKDAKATENLPHINPDPDDYDAEVWRIVALGARRIDIGQSADVPCRPHRACGQRFCLLRPHASLIE